MIAPDWNEPIFFLFRGGGRNEDGGGGIGGGDVDDEDGGSGDTCDAGGMILLPSTATSLNVLFACGLESSLIQRVVSGVLVASALDV